MPAAFLTEKDAILGAHPLPAGCIQVNGIDIIGFQLGIVNSKLFDQFQLRLYPKLVEAELAGTDPELLPGRIIMAGSDVILAVKDIAGNGDQILHLPANIPVAVRKAQQRLLPFSQAYLRGQRGVVHLKQAIGRAHPFVVRFVNVEIENNRIVFYGIATIYFHRNLLSSRDIGQGQKQKG